MKFDVKYPPRRYEFNGVTLSDCGAMRLAPNEQITFVTDTGAEYDVTRKEWGFYATPSLNSRLARMGLRGALAYNPNGKLFVMLVEAGREASFEAYLDRESCRIVAWLDTDAAVGRLLAKLEKDT